MVNVLLISPPEQYFCMEAGDRPYLGVLYIASALRKAGHDVVLSDLNHDSYSVLERKIEENNPEFIGMYTMTPYFSWFTNFARHLRNRFPESRLIAGGPHATIDPQSLTDVFDFVVRGEGEKAVVDIVEGKTEEQIVQYPYEEDLDSLEMPARDLLPLDERYGIRVLGERSVSLISSRSCPYSCFFCAKNILGPRQRTHSVDYTLDEIEEIQSRFGFSSFSFYDDCFTFDRERVMKFAQGVLDRGLKIKYKIVTRTDRVDREMLELMKEGGLNFVSFGLEHMDNEILRRVNKSNTVENIEGCLKLAREVGLNVKGTWILNLPGATRETMYQTLQASMDYLDFAHWFTLIAYPGTPLWSNPEKYGMRILPHKYDFSNFEGYTNVEMIDGTRLDLEGILGDIKNKWRKFKGSSAPWES